ncbi:MAG: hypothetical protein L0H55_10825 [Candidatus Nitrosocosmicus sp.]|nr:hypothetical protein [Candidatus Nitrosocosmicus sp.]
MVFICIFLDYPLDVLPEQYFIYSQSKEAMSQFGSGFKNVILERYPQRERKLRNTSSMNL